MRAICSIIIAWLVLATLNGQTATAKAGTMVPEKAKVDTLRLGEARLLHLTVLNKEIARGSKDVKLKNFDLTVRVYNLPDSISPAANQPLLSSAPGRWLFVHNRTSRYYRRDEKNRRNEEDADYMLGNQQKLFCNGVAMPFLSLDESFAGLEIRSQVEMSREDSLFIGEFRFQPGQPGLYRLVWQISRHHEITDTLNQYVYFECPAYALTLRVQNEGLLHHISYKRFGIPLVTSAFFEARSAAISTNEPDRIFRNTFIATAAKRMACGKYDATLPILYDKTTNENAQIGKARAKKLQALLQETTSLMSNGQPCETAFTVREARAAEWERFIKPRTEISPEQFSQENRVAPLVLDLAAQRRVLSPLEVLSNEKSDDVALAATIEPPTYLAECLRSGKLVVEDGSGQSYEEELPLPDLPQILRGAGNIQIKSASTLQFLRHGVYTARLHLTLGCRDRELWSNPVTFFIERRLNVLRDEIFALNLYDKPDFAYELDKERVANLAETILQTARDTLLHNPSPTPPDALVLISGHACILGEVVSRFYNLGLSFGRALFLRHELLAAIRQHGKRYGITVQFGDELCAAKPLISKFIDNPDIIKLLNQCFQANDGRALESSYESYLQRLIREKVRHFESPAAGFASRPQGAPDSAQIRQRIEEIKHVLPGSVVTLALKQGGKTVNIHFVAVGFGAAVPFYRHFDMPEEMREAFAKMGAAVPNSLYGDDRYPAGRLMNRRVEVNLLW